MPKTPSVPVPGALMSTAQQGEVSKESWEGKENGKALALSEKTQAGPEQNDVLSSPYSFCSLKYSTYTQNNSEH